MEDAECPASSLCWRKSYTEYCKSICEKYSCLASSELPNRGEMFRLGFAYAKMFPKAGIFAETLPSVENGKVKNGCPFEKEGNSLCQEYAKYKRKTEIKHTWARRYTEQRPRINLPPAVRCAVAKKFNYTCVYCGRSHNQADGRGGKIKVVIDHFIPLALGGGSDIENLVCACSTCNRDKSAARWEIGCRKGFYEEKP